MRRVALVVAAVVLVVALPARGVDAELLAPTVEGMRALVGEVDALVVEAEVVGRVVHRAQNRWIDRRASKRHSSCRDEELASLVARARAFGAAERDLIQASRVLAHRLRRVLDSASVAPLATAEDRDRVAELEDRVEDLGEAWLVSAAWQRRVPEPWAWHCTLELTPADGLLPSHVRSRGELTDDVAVAAVGGGVLCPGSLPADGSVHVVEGGLACWHPVSCRRCEPQRVEPGAILGAP